VVTNGSGEPLRLLVVDDDVVVPMLIAMGLDDVEIVEASRATEALHLTDELRPDAVIVDRTLPDGDGLALVRALRSAPATADVPIVVVTAGHDEDLRSEVLRAGADEYLPKPVEPHQLEALVRRLLSVTSAQLRQRRERSARSLPLHAAAPEELTPP
jgi:DNA-binding response OmpR family regulator